MDKEDKRRSNKAGRQAITLGELAEAGVGVLCWCNECHHNATLASRDLMVALARPLAVPELARHLRCKACGARNVSTRPAWPGLGQVTRH